MSGYWLPQLKWQAVLVKILLLWVALRVPDLEAGLFIPVILLSGIVAHAPAGVGCRSPFGIQPKMTGPGAGS